MVVRSERGGKKYSQLSHRLPAARRDLWDHLRRIIIPGWLSGYARPWWIDTFYVKHGFDSLREQFFLDMIYYNIIKYV